MAFSTYAAINVGSNELSMKILEISKKSGIRELTHIRHTTELGADTYTNGMIGNELIHEVCHILSGFKDVMSEFGVTDYGAYATSALREASNNITVVDRVRIRCGLKIKILSNSEQRFLRYKAIALKGDAFHSLIQQGTAIVDVGSGSSQLSLFSNESLVSTQNIPLGSLRIKELLRFIENQSDDYNVLMEEYVNCDMKVLRNMYLSMEKIENLIAIGDQLFDIKRFAGLLGKGDTLKKADFNEVYEYLLSLTPTEISHKLSIPAEQAMLLLPTMMIYHNILKTSGAKSVWLCDVTLCDGMVAEHMEKKERAKPSHDFTNDIIGSARQIAHRYQSDVLHTGNVENLSLRIFDSLRKIHGMGKRERLLLQIAVILHDCGNYINMRDASENSYRIILATEIIGLSHLERELVAYLVRYITASFPSYGSLIHIFETDDYIKIMKLTAILRIAHSLDKSRQQKCLDVHIAMKENQMIITIETVRELTLEKLLFNQKAVFFEQVYGISPVIKQKRRLQYGK